MSNEKLSNYGKGPVPDLQRLVEDSQQWQGSVSRKRYFDQDGNAVHAPGSFTEEDAREKIAGAKAQARKAVTKAFAERREAARRAARGSVPAGLRETIETMKQLGASDAEVQELQVAHSGNYWGARLIAAEFGESHTSAIVQPPKLNDVLSRLDDVEDRLERHCFAQGADLNSYEAQVYTKGEPVERALAEADSFAEFSGD